MKYILSVLFLLFSPMVQAQSEFDTDVHLNGGAQIVLANAGNSHAVHVGVPSSLGTDLTFQLPTTAGSAGQALVTDGAGHLSWATVTPTTYTATWAAADGASRQFTHGLGTTDVTIIVYDIATGATIQLAERRTTANDVVLTASETPPDGGWKVVIKQ